MTCEEALAQLDDFVDGELSEAVTRELERHVAGCAACAGQVAERRVLVARTAGLPHALAPERDLWPGIARRLRPARPVMFERGGRRWPRPALAAAATILAAAMLWRTDEILAPAHVPAHDATGQRVSLSLDRDYEEAAADLMRAVEARRGRLTPEARARVDESLRVIAQALAAIRVELAKAPGDPALNHLLLSVHQKRIEVLRTLAQLAA